MTAYRLWYALAIDYSIIKQRLSRKFLFSLDKMARMRYNKEKRAYQKTVCSFHL